MSSATTTSNNSSGDCLKQRSVVSSLIFSPDDGATPRVALFRRSSKVRTYTHHLAPISGSIETSDPTPLSAALRELREETTLTLSNLSLWRQGKPFTFADLSVGREWTVYPFAFRLKTRKDEKRIKIDWEHGGWGWYDPFAVEDSEKFGGVPKLHETLRRTFWEADLGPEVGRVLSEGCEELRTDYVSGARVMATNALKTLRRVVAELPLPSTSEGNEGLLRVHERQWAAIRMAAWHLVKNGRESMGAAILSVLLSALTEIDEVRIAAQSPRKGREKTLELLDRRIQGRESGGGGAGAVARTLSDYLQREFWTKVERGESLRILTLSESSTIRLAISQLAMVTDLKLDLRVLESRPLFEGVSLAASLAKEFDSAAKARAGASLPAQSHRITIYTDAEVALAAADSGGVDVVVIGADRIAASGAVSNKTGSLPTVLSAKHVTGGRAKVLVLGETEKIAMPGRPEDHVVEENAAEQVTEAWDAAGRKSGPVCDATTALEERMRTELESLEGGDESARSRLTVSVRNVFFEWCPPELIDVYVTERGEWEAEDIAMHSQRLQELEQRFFGGL